MCETITTAFINIESQHHILLYNNRVVSMDYISGQKQQFKFGCARISDNLGTGETPTDVGFIKTPSGLFYQVSRSARSAKKVEQSEVQ